MLQKACYRSPSPEHPPIPDFDELNRLLTRKPERSYSVVFRGSSTPEVHHPDFLRQLLNPLEYWKDQAILHERKIRLLDPSNDYRMSIDSIEYWVTEANHLSHEYSLLYQRKNRERWARTQKKVHEESTIECTKDAPTKVTKNKNEKNIRSAREGPISSRLRSRARYGDPASRSSLTAAAAPTRISKTEPKPKTRNKARNR